MGAHREHVRYVAVFAVVAAAVLAPVLALNLLLGRQALGSTAAVIHASAWQRATHGVTYAPPLSANRPFKTARLYDRLPEINTVVLGSSTAMGITQSMFPPGITLYNYAQTGNALMTAIAEAEFLQHRAQHLKWFVIPLDWALGFIYQPGTPGPVDLAPPAAGASLPQPPLARQLQDALSLPRVQNLFGIIANVVRAPSPAAAFHAAFFEEASADYRCADGTPAKDYDTIFRGTCTGFRYDGSATFANLEPVSAPRAEALIASAVVPSSKYAAALAASNGVPNPVLLDRLAALARNMRERGGGLILLLPPLLPGLERALLEAPATAEPLRRTKDALAAWARAHELTLIDAGPAERYGCATSEFVDEHHALPACYARIFAHYWKERE